MSTRCCVKVIKEFDDKTTEVMLYPRLMSSSIAPIYAHPRGPPLDRTNATSCFMITKIIKDTLKTCLLLF